jgi:excisionase family DNA binding protein
MSNVESSVVAALAYDVPAAARLMGVGTTKAWELVRPGQLPSIRIGRRRLVTRQALDRFTERAERHRCLTGGPGDPGVELANVMAAASTTSGFVIQTGRSTTGPS